MAIELKGRPTPLLTGRRWPPSSPPTPPFDNGGANSTRSLMSNGINRVGSATAVAGLAAQEGGRPQSEEGGGSVGGEGGVFVAGGGGSIDGRRRADAGTVGGFGWWGGRGGWRRRPCSG